MTRRSEGRHGLTRRAVLRGGLTGAATLASARLARAAAVPTPYVPAPPAPQMVLRVGTTPRAPAGGAPAAAVLVNQALPGPELRLRAGDPLRMLVENGLPDAPTTIHWHGMLVPSGMDGVPDVSNAPIPPAGVYLYEYPLRQTGTYWYHSHYGFQEQQGCYGALIVEPREVPPDAPRDAVVLLGDWLRRDPAAVFAALRAGGPAAGRTPMAGMPMPPAGTAAPMAMAGADLADVTYDAFLLNGHGPQTPWTFTAEPGERLRLRLINAGASTFFRVALDDHRLQITHADGLAVEPVEVDHLLIGMGETYDALITMGAAGRYTLHAVAQDGSGQALGVLHAPGTAPIANHAMPALAGRALTYADLRAPLPTTLPDGPSRRFRLPLEGDMTRYVWMIDGAAWPDAGALRIARGERVEVELINRTGMWHPMHLHGHFFRLLQGAGAHCPLKHTVNIAPGETLRFEFFADNPGNWFFHCHNVYHLEAGMARVFTYTA